MDSFQNEMPKWSPQYLTKWIEWVRNNGNFPPARLDRLMSLANERRMREFWDWVGVIEFARAPILRNSHTIAEAIIRATQLPNFPGNLTPAQRDAYFEKVRKYTLALMELLRDTKFDTGISQEVTDDEMDAPLGDKLRHWGDGESEDGDIVAFNVGINGVYRMHYDYPGSNLTETLAELYEWTFWDDQWDGRIFSSSTPIVQTNSDSARVVYFTCSLYDWFTQYGVEMPFPILATVANVALDLGADEQVDEEAVRKQVRRYQARRAKFMAEHPPAFDGDTGQNFEKLDDSVLSDPF